MATLAHSYTIERPAYHRPKPRSVERIAIDRIGARQLALAECVAAFLDTAYEGEWEWEASDNFFGTPVDSAVITGKTPNGDGTHSGVILVGDMDILGPMLRAMGMDRQRPKSFAEALLERVHWLDDFWGPLPLPYHLTQWIEEQTMAMTDNQFQQFMKEQRAMHAELLAALSGKPVATEPKTFWVRVKDKWDVLALIVVMVLAGGAGLRFFTTSITEAVSPIAETLNGPDGHPEKGLVMDVRSLTGYQDSNGNKVPGKIDVMNEKLDKLLIEPKETTSQRKE